MEMKSAQVIFYWWISLAWLAPGSALALDNATSPALPPAGPLARFSAEQRQKLLAGEAIYEYSETGAPGQGRGQAMVLINAPLDTCFKIFRALAQQSQYFPRKTRSDIVKTEGNTVLVHNEFDYYVITVEYYAI